MIVLTAIGGWTVAIFAAANAIDATTKAISVSVVRQTEAKIPIAVTACKAAATARMLAMMD